MNSSLPLNLCLLAMLSTGFFPHFNFPLKSFVAMVLRTLAGLLGGTWAEGTCSAYQNRLHFEEVRVQQQVAVYSIGWTFNMMKISFVWITCPAQMWTSVILHDESRLQVAAEEGVRCFQIIHVVNVK